MAGLALGAVLAERRAAGAPLRVFAALEAGIAVAALATPVLLARPRSSIVRCRTPPRFPRPLTVARFVLLGRYVPTVLMGATLPVLVTRRSCGRRRPRAWARYAVTRPAH
jgi:hypothetical protein